jgi:hypothetical protein
LNGRSFGAGPVGAKPSKGLSPTPPLPTARASPAPVAGVGIRAGRATVSASPTLTSASNSRTAASLQKPGARGNCASFLAVDAFGDAAARFERGEVGQVGIRHFVAVLAVAISFPLLVRDQAILLAAPQRFERVARRRVSRAPRGISRGVRASIRERAEYRRRGQAVPRVPLLAGNAQHRSWIFPRDPLFEGLWQGQPARARRFGALRRSPPRVPAGEPPGGCRQSRWRKRFCLTRLPGLEDELRGGRKARSSPLSRRSGKGPRLSSGGDHIVGKVFGSEEDDLSANDVAIR